ncbi:2-keto-4-pentenoate hydratase [Streptomyces sp. NPDC090075]|uniref:2-keto-4-pentenoate hydratase n=1 Tax=Streptomyces sp. NPDC090075 TaxID=3365937 RepID=UPI003822FA57
MLSDAETEKLAADLHRARAEVHTIPQPALQYPDMGIEDAYAVQRRGVRMVLDGGGTVIGRKVGLTAIPMQRAMGIEEPDYGVLYDDMLVPDGGRTSAAAFNYPRVEMELAYVLERDLRGPGVTPEDVRAATGYVCPAIEILDSRVQMTDPATGRRRSIVDTVADNAADAGLVLGPGRADAGELRPRAVGAELLVNGEIVDTGLATAVLGDPARAVAWLANKLAVYGEHLTDGSVVLSGSFISSVHVVAGDLVEADFGELGAVSCRFT